MIHNKVVVPIGATAFFFAFGLSDETPSALRLL